MSTKESASFRLCFSRLRLRTRSQKLRIYRAPALRQHPLYRRYRRLRELIAGSVHVNGLRRRARQLTFGCRRWLSVGSPLRHPRLLRLRGEVAVLVRDSRRVQRVLHVGAHVQRLPDGGHQRGGRDRDLETGLCLGQAFLPEHGLVHLLDLDLPLVAAKDLGVDQHPALVPVLAHDRHVPLLGQELVVELDPVLSHQLVRERELELLRGQAPLREVGEERNLGRRLLYRLCLPQKGGGGAGDVLDVGFDQPLGLQGDVRREAGHVQNLDGGEVIHQPHLAGSEDGCLQHRALALFHDQVVQQLQVVETLVLQRPQHLLQILDQLHDRDPLHPKEIRHGAAGDEGIVAMREDFLAITPLREQDLLVPDGDDVVFIVPAFQDFDQVLGAIHLKETLLTRGQGIGEGLGLLQLVHVSVHALPLQLFQILEAEPHAVRQALGGGDVLGRFVGDEVSHVHHFHRGVVLGRLRDRDLPLHFQRPTHLVRLGEGLLARDHALLERPPRLPHAHARDQTLQAVGALLEDHPVRISLRAQEDLQSLRALHDRAQLLGTAHALPRPHLPARIGVQHPGDERLHDLQDVGRVQGRAPLGGWRGAFQDASPGAIPAVHLGGPQVVSFQVFLVLAQNAGEKLTLAFGHRLLPVFLADKTRTQLALHRVHAFLRVTGQEHLHEGRYLLDREQVFLVRLHLPPFVDQLQHGAGKVGRFGLGASRTLQPPPALHGGHDRGQRVSTTHALPAHALTLIGVGISAHHALRLIGVGKTCSEGRDGHQGIPALAPCRTREGLASDPAGEPGRACEPASGSWISCTAGSTTTTNGAVTMSRINALTLMRILSGSASRCRPRPESYGGAARGRYGCGRALEWADGSARDGAHSGGTGRRGLSPPNTHPYFH